jgi:hypothetical protein
LFIIDPMENRIGQRVVDLRHATRGKAGGLLGRLAIPKKERPG